MITACGDNRDIFSDLYDLTQISNQRVRRVINKIIPLVPQNKQITKKLLLAVWKETQHERSVKTLINIYHSINCIYHPFWCKYHHKNAVNTFPKDHCAACLRKQSKNFVILRDCIKALLYRLEKECNNS